MILEGAPKSVEDELASLLLGIYPSISGFGASDSPLDNILYDFAYQRGYKWKKV